MEIIDIKNLDDINYNKYLIIFYTNLCSKCKIMEQTLSNIKNDIPIFKIDASKNRVISKKYGVMSTPTILYFNNENYDKKQGIVNEDEILKWIE